MKLVNAMDEEIDVIEKNQRLELVSLPHGKEVIGVKWVYKTKLNANGDVKKHKERLVEKNPPYSQQPGVDYNETFAMVSIPSTGLHPDTNTRLQEESTSRPTRTTYATPTPSTTRPGTTISTTHCILLIDAIMRNDILP
jgi:hypothetical protein